MSLQVQSKFEIYGKPHVANCTINAVICTAVAWLSNEDCSQLETFSIKFVQMFFCIRCLPSRSSSSTHHGRRWSCFANGVSHLTSCRQLACAPDSVPRLTPFRCVEWPETAHRVRTKAVSSIVVLVMGWAQARSLPVVGFELLANQQASVSLFVFF